MNGKVLYRHMLEGPYTSFCETSGIKIPWAPWRSLEHVIQVLDLIEVCHTQFCFKLRRIANGLPAMFRCQLTSNSRWKDLLSWHQILKITIWCASLRYRYYTALIARYALNSVLSALQLDTLAILQLLVWCSKRALTQDSVPCVPLCRYASTSLVPRLKSSYAVLLLFFGKVHPDHYLSHQLIRQSNHNHFLLNNALLPMLRLCLPSFILASYKFCSKGFAHE